MKLSYWTKNRKKIKLFHSWKDVVNSIDSDFIFVILQ